MVQQGGIKACCSAAVLDTTPVLLLFTYIIPDVINDSLSFFCLLVSFTGSHWSLLLKKWWCWYIIVSAYHIERGLAISLCWMLYFFVYAYVPVIIASTIPRIPTLLSGTLPSFFNFWALYFFPSSPPLTHLLSHLPHFLHLLHPSITFALLYPFSPPSPLDIVPSFPSPLHLTPHLCPF